MKRDKAGGWSMFGGKFQKDLRIWDQVTKSALGRKIYDEVVHQELMLGSSFSIGS